MKYILGICLVLLIHTQSLNGNGRHRKHKNKEIGFV